MTFKLPLCAWCGKSLAGRRPRVVETNNNLPGGPSYGWHMSGPESEPCFKQDEWATPWTTRSIEMQQRQVNAIAERGLRRIVFTRNIK